MMGPQTNKLHPRDRRVISLSRDLIGFDCFVQILKRLNKDFRVLPGICASPPSQEKLKQGLRISGCLFELTIESSGIDGGWRVGGYPGGPVNGWLMCACVFSSLKACG